MLEEFTALDLMALLDQVRDRLHALVGNASPEQLALTVPATGGRSVRDVLAHLADAAVRGPQGTGSACAGPIAEADLSAKAGCLLDDWDRALDAIRPQLSDPARCAGVLVDAVIHEHDVRAVLDRPGFRDDLSVLRSLDILAEELSERVSAAGLPALRVTVEQWGSVAGQGPALRCLVADRFELVRGLTGRRSASQIERWNWDTPPGRYLEVLSGAGRLADTDVRERDPRVPDHLRDFDLAH